MAVTRAPKRPPPAETPTAPASEDRVREVILRGGTVAADLHEGTSEKEGFSDPVKNVQLRLYKSLLQEIDAARQQQARGRKPASRHAWMVQAIEEKLEREQKKKRY